MFIKKSMIAEKITKIKTLRREKELIMQEMNEQTRPVKANLDDIPSVFEKFKSVANPDYRDNIKIFIFLVFYMYSPVSCIGRSVRGGVRRRIAKLLQVTNSSVSQQFSDAKVLFDKHRGFKAETERIYALLLSE